MGSNKRKRKRKRKEIVKMSSPKIGSNAASKATSGDQWRSMCLQGDTETKCNNPIVENQEWLP